MGFNSGFKGLISTNLYDILQRKRNSILTSILRIDISRYFFTAKNFSYLFKNNEIP